MRHFSDSASESNHPHTIQHLCVALRDNPNEAMMSAREEQAIAERVRMEQWQDEQQLADLARSEPVAPAAPKAIPCKVRASINYLDKLIGVAIVSPKTGREIYFGPATVQFVPKGIQDRIRIGEKRGGTATFTTDELLELIELNAAHPEPSSAPRYNPFAGTFSRSKFHRASGCR